MRLETSLNGVSSRTDMQTTRQPERPCNAPKNANGFLGAARPTGSPLSRIPPKDTK